MTPDGTTRRHPPRLLQQVRDQLRRLHDSYRTEQKHVYWIRFFILFSGQRHPREMGKPEVERFLTHLATYRNVAASAQNQALSVLLFLYKQVLEVEIDWIDDVVPARQPAPVPALLNREEVATVLTRMTGHYWLMASLMYGTGLRVAECLQLRV